MTATPGRAVGAAPHPPRPGSATAALYPEPRPEEVPWPRRARSNRRARRRPVADARTRSRARYQAVVDNVDRVIQGKTEVVELVLLGHARRRPRPHRGRPRRGQDQPGQGPGRLHRRHLRPHPVHARPAALRRRGRERLRPPVVHLRLPARPGVRQRGPGRRDQPGLAQDPVGPARGHGRGPGHRGRAPPTTSTTPSWCWPPRTRPSTRGPTRSPTASSTASCSGCRWATRRPRRSWPSSTTTAPLDILPALRPVVSRRRRGGHGRRRPPGPRRPGPPPLPGRPGHRQPGRPPPGPGHVAPCHPQPPARRPGPGRGRWVASSWCPTTSRPSPCRPWPTACCSPRRRPWRGTTRSRVVDDLLASVPAPTSAGARR